MCGLLIFLGILICGYLYMLFSRFVAYIFINDFNWKSFKADWNYEADDMGLENATLMFIWPIAIIEWCKEKFSKNNI